MHLGSDHSQRLFLPRPLVQTTESGWMCGAGQWFSALAAHWNHLENLKRTDTWVPRREVWMRLVWGAAWTQGFLDAPKWSPWTARFEIHCLRSLHSHHPIWSLQEPRGGGRQVAMTMSCWRRNKFREAKAYLVNNIWIYSQACWLPALSSLLSSGLIERGKAMFPRTETSSLTSLVS